MLTDPKTHIYQSPLFISDHCQLHRPKNTYILFSTLVKHGYSYYTGPASHCTCVIIDSRNLYEHVRGGFSPAAWGAPPPALRPQANRLSSTNFKACAPYAMTMTATFYFTAIGGIVAKLAFRNSALGLFGPPTAPSPPVSISSELSSNALHFTFAPYDMKLMAIILDTGNIDADEGEDNCSALVDWVSMNVYRGLLADIPGFVYATSLGLCCH
ncbi:hypothetical protein F4804DRAFT_316375 [Jackrogersella minutella]|nr:hypothetical protein F4804DRAFT_316375 [Jackrogersella minutella]